MKPPVNIAKIVNSEGTINAIDRLFLAVVTATLANPGVLHQMADAAGGKDPAIMLGRYAANICNGIITGYNERVQEFETGEQPPPPSGIIVPN